MSVRICNESSVAVNEQGCRMRPGRNVLSYWAAPNPSIDVIGVIQRRENNVPGEAHCKWLAACLSSRYDGSCPTIEFVNLLICSSRDKNSMRRRILSNAVDQAAYVKICTLLRYRRIC